MPASLLAKKRNAFLRMSNGTPEPSLLLAAVVLTAGVGGYYFSRLLGGKDPLPWASPKRKRKRRSRHSAPSRKGEGGTRSGRRSQASHLKLWRVQMSEDEARQRGVEGPRFFEPRLDMTFQFDEEAGAYVSYTIRATSAEVAAGLGGYEAGEAEENAPVMLPEQERAKSRDSGESDDLALLRQELERARQETEALRRQLERGQD